MNKSLKKKIEICNLANIGKEFINEENKNISGLSGRKLCNALCGFTKNMGEENIYLEIGVYKGLTLLTNAASNPEVKCIGIDNFSLFNENHSNKDIVLNQIKELKLKNVELIDLDFEEALDNLKNHIDPNKKIGVFFIDGPHDYRSQLISLMKIKNYLAEDCVIIIDDANYVHVRQATKDFLSTESEFKLLCEAYTKAHVANLSDLDKKEVIDGWWNGVNIIVRDLKNDLKINLPNIEKEYRDFNFYTHDLMRSKYVEINHILVNHLIKLNEDKQNNELLISKIKSLLKKHNNKYPKRYINQNTYSENLNKFKVYS